MASQYTLIEKTHTYIVHVQEHCTCMYRAGICLGFLSGENLHKVQRSAACSTHTYKMLYALHMYNCNIDRHTQAAGSAKQALLCEGYVQMYMYMYMYVLFLKVSQPPLLLLRQVYI